MHVDVAELLKEPGMTKICAPMVRYSKLQFRSLVRKYNCDVCFTPMILADSFVQSVKARNNEFTTNKSDCPLIVQFAAKSADDFVCAAEMVAPYCDGVDLNCGCPQRWAIKDGYGVELLNNPQLIKDLTSQVRNRIPMPFTVSVKMRLLKDIRKSIELCRTLEKSGISFLTIHARTPQMRKEPIDLDGLKLLRDSVQLPLVANGDIKTLEDAWSLHNKSRCEGVMAASGILSNPALFSGYRVTPLSCVQDWLDITSSIPTQFLSMHHHLVFMLEKILPKAERRLFNALQSKDAVLNFMEDYYDLKPRVCSKIECPVNCHYNVQSKKHCIKEIDNCLNTSFGDIFGTLFLDL